MQARRWPGAVGNGRIVAYRARSPVWRLSAKHAQMPFPQSLTRPAARQMFGPHPSRAAMYTPVVEDYLKAVWMLQQQESPVSTSRIAERLGLTAAAATGLMEVLGEEALMRYQP